MSQKKLSDRQRIISELREVKGIGPRTAEKIYDKCGRKNCLEQLERNPEAVAKLVGISRELALEAKSVLRPAAFGKRAGSGGLTRLLTEIEDVQREYGRHWNALNQQRKYCDMIFAKHRDRLIARPDVTGVHIGLWREKGKIVCPLQFCIRVHVVKKLGLEKLDATMLEANSLMPTPLETMIDGVRVDILQQTYRKTMALPSNATVQANPLEGGVPISPSDQSKTWGTLGMPVLHLHDGLRRFLTNAHVVKSDNTFMQQPASESPRDNFKIGQVKEATIQDDTIDAALITPNDNRPSKRRIQGVDGGFITRDLTQADVDMRTEVFKVGAATGRTRGRLKSINATIDFGHGNVMHNQILVDPIDEKLIERGDSGSILFARNADNDINIIVGLVHGEANSDSVGGVAGLVACHISKVVDELRVQF